MTGVRMDKWLWVARFFKTRALAAKSCELGRIQCNGLSAKPAREVRVGDSLQIKSERGFSSGGSGSQRGSGSRIGRTDALPGN